MWTAPWSIRADEFKSTVGDAGAVPLILDRLRRLVAAADVVEAAGGVLHNLALDRSSGTRASRYLLSLSCNHIRSSASLRGCPLPWWISFVGCSNKPGRVKVQTRSS